MPNISVNLEACKAQHSCSLPEPPPRQHTQNVNVDEGSNQKLDV